jgi:hypothetical protein
MNYNINAVNWFPVTVFHTQIEDQLCDKLIEKVMMDKDTWKKGLKNVHAKTTGWNCLGKYKELDEINLLIIQTLLPKIGESQNWKFNNWRTHGAWINFYEKEDFAQLHNHWSCNFCAVLILKAGEGNLLFHNHRALQGLFENFEEITNEKINEKKGSLIFFPSDLFHSVTKCNSDRISVAFNFINEEFQ